MEKQPNVAVFGLDSTDTVILVDLSAAQRIGALNKLVADDDIAAGRSPVTWSSGPDRVRQRTVQWCQTLSETGGLRYVLRRRHGDLLAASASFAEMLELHRAEGFTDVEDFPPVTLLFHHETGIVATVERWSPPGDDCEPQVNVARWYFTALVTDPPVFNAINYGPTYYLAPGFPKENLHFEQLVGDLSGALDAAALHFGGIEFHDAAITERMIMLRASCRFLVPHRWPPAPVGTFAGNIRRSAAGVFAMLPKHVRAVIEE